MPNAKDLTKEAPRSANEELGGFAVIARTIDKCRAHINGTIGEYHFNCPVDKMLFDWKGIEGESFREFVGSGADDAAIVDWVRSHGAPKTDEEIANWSAESKAYNPITDPEKAEWFRGECERLSLDPNTTSLFVMLDVDDKATFPASA